MRRFYTERSLGFILWQKHATYNNNNNNYYYYIIIIVVVISCHRPFLPGTSLEPLCVMFQVYYVMLSILLLLLLLLLLGVRGGVVG